MSPACAEEQTVYQRRILAASVSAGASSLSLKNCNGALLAGDFIGLGGQLLMVESDVAPIDGRMTVQVNPAVRLRQAIDTPVVWERPHVLWVLNEKDATKFPYRPGGMRPSFSIDLIEDWS